MCDKKNNVLFTNTECIVLSPDFKLLDESQVLLKVPRNHNMYNFDLKNVVPIGGLTCLFAKATLDESSLCHRRLGHTNFKTMNKLVRGNLVRGLPLKLFENDHTCVAYQKEKQHKASCKTKTTYCLVITDDFSRFTWFFFLATKDETPEILKNFIACIENQMDHKVKTIRCHNRIEFKNRIMNEFCEMKGIRREFSVARTPQQNGVAERKNRTLIEIARTMLADSKLPTTFWAEAVNTACYVQNRVLVIKPHNKTPYEPFLGQDGKKIVLSPQYVLLPLWTSDSQGPKSSEDEVADAEKKSTKVLIKENKVQDLAKEGDKNDIKRRMLEIKKRPFENNLNKKDCFVKGRLLTTNRLNTVSSLVNTVSSSFTTVNSGRERAQRNEFKSMFGQDKDANDKRMFTPVSVARSSYVNLGGSIPVNAVTLLNADLPTDPFMLDLEDTDDLQDTGIFSGAYDDEVEGVEAGFNNLELTIVVSPIPITRIHKDHPKEQIIEDTLLALQTRRITKTSQEHAMVMQRDDGIFIIQDKYVADILKKFDFSSVNITSTPIETNKALLKDEEAEDVDVYLYRLMIGSLMYLTAFRPDIMFAVCACARFQVTPKVSHLYAMKRIFRYLKVANSTTEAEYVAAANCFGQMELVMNLELKLIVAEVCTVEKKLVMNGCLDWNETTANDEIQVSVVGLTYYWFNKAVWLDLVK
nr:putative ribonuclease H-like domain-containing protein [Tanacetum cinerariifolium]